MDTVAEEAVLFISSWTDDCCAKKTAAESMLQINTKIAYFSLVFKEILTHFKLDKSYMFKHFLLSIRRRSCGPNYHNALIR